MAYSVYLCFQILLGTCNIIRSQWLYYFAKWYSYLFTHNDMIWLILRFYLLNFTVTYCSYKGLSLGCIDYEINKDGKSQMHFNLVILDLIDLLPPTAWCIPSGIADSWNNWIIIIAEQSDDYWLIIISYCMFVLLRKQTKNHETVKALSI